MGTALEAYIITIFIDGKELKIDTKQVAFQIDTSIWKILPTGNVIIQDPSGLLQEFLLTVPGTKLDITFGYEESFYKVPFIIVSDILPEVENASTNGGTLTIPVIHAWAFKQDPKLTSFDDRISGVLRTLTTVFPFNKVNINDTENQNFWYQSLKTDVEFIEEILLPKAFSRNSKFTPFFCFIDGQNNFNFQHYKYLSTQKPITILEYKEVVGKDFNLNIVADYSRKRMSFFEDELFHNRIVYGLSTTDGSVISEVDSIEDYSLKQPNDKIPYRKDQDISNYTYYEKLYDLDDVRGNRIFNQRKSISQEEILLVIPYNPEILAGSMVTFQTGVSGKNDDGSNLSQFSGNYLVEFASAIYDGFNQQAIMKLVITRKFNKYTNNYLLKNSLVGA